MEKCQICGREFKSIKSLRAHLVRFHKMSTKEAYDTFFRKPGEGICPICGKETRFNRNQYNQYCSKECRSVFLSEFTKNLHEELDGPKYCETCGRVTNHVIGIGCASCWNQNINDTLTERIQAKYGVDSVLQLDWVKDKIRETSEEKYGTSNPGNSIEGRRKARETRRKNGNISPSEDRMAKALKKNGINFIQEYKDEERYPFFCDFYFPDSDTFLELNTFWSHQDHYFDPNNPEDAKKLEFWKSKAKKGHKQYANSVDVWSVRDPEKRAIAEKNNLNYIVLWTPEEIKAFIKEKKFIGL